MKINLFVGEGASRGVMVNKLDKRTFTSDFESYLVPHS